MKTGKIGLENLDPKNRATYMTNSGSKGKLTNIAQMEALSRQQNVDGNVYLMDLMEATSSLL